MIAGSMIVYAQQPGSGVGADDTSNVASPHSNFSLEDMAAFSDARIAALHAGLKLNADQEKNWPALEQALHDLAKMRIDRLSAARDEQRATDPVQRLQRQADALSSYGAVLKRLADTLAPLYQSFDDGQKRRFTILARFMGSHRQHTGWQRGMRGRGGMYGDDVGG
jgi:zinc resistance-associated protein